MRSAVAGAPDASRPTLAQVFGLALAALGLLLGGLFSVVLSGSRESLMRSAASLARQKSAAAAGQVAAGLRQAESTAASLERQVRFGTCDADDPAAVEAWLAARLLDDEELAEATFTRAALRGLDEEGRPLLGAGPRWQVSVYRASAERGSPILTRIVRQEGSRRVAQVRERAAGDGLSEGRWRLLPETPPDPLDHPTFVTPLADQAAPDLPGRPQRFTWTDLSYSELDQGLPEARRRVVLTVMRVARRADGSVLGVVRLGRLQRQVEAAVRGLGAFLCDERGRLLTRVDDGDRLDFSGDDLRFPGARASPALAQTLALAGRPEVGGGNGLDELLVAAGRPYLAHVETLPGTQDWRVGLVLAVDDLPGYPALRRARERLLQGALALIALTLAAGLLLLRSIGGGLAHVTRSAGRLRDFDFSPSPAQAPFRDLREAEGSLELAKTALRAMSKYVPVGLVRELYRTRQEPRLGGELRDVSILFTDLEGFTSLAEGVEPDELARLLGRYLEVMTAAIHATGGIVDKYVGDSVMALWNAPHPVAGHPAAACAAALRCATEAQALFASPEWAGRPPLVTRFGLHRATVMVGHFGAPDRLSYTALGDGVNLAARLEGLNKQYGTHLLVSDDVRAAAGEGFLFRRLDRVAVKGKRQGVLVHELLGPGPGPLPTRAQRYEEALERCWARDFAGALELLGPQPDDPPSQVLAERCRTWCSHPPPESWDGVFRATSK